MKSMLKNSLIWQYSHNSIFTLGKSETAFSSAGGFSSIFFLEAGLGRVLGAGLEDLGTSLVSLGLGDIGTFSSDS